MDKMDDRNIILVIYTDKELDNKTELVIEGRNIIITDKEQLRVDLHEAVDDYVNVAVSEKSDTEITPTASIPRAYSGLSIGNLFKRGK